MLADFDDDRGIAAGVDQSPMVRVCGGVEVRSLDGSLTPGQLDDFAALAETGAGDIARFTGVSERTIRIIIYLSPQVAISHTYPDYPGGRDREARVFIDSTRVAEGSAPYLHELVHAVVGDGGAMWLEEGFADWVASSVATKYGGYYAPVLSAANDGIDAQARAVIERWRGDEASQSWFTTDEPRMPSRRERRNYYILAHSFTKFLATSLGTPCLVSVHRANDLNELARASGVPLEEWRRRWLAELGGTPHS